MEIKPPIAEASIGMEVYKSQTPGIGGFLKKLPEDFRVEEITAKGIVLEIDGTYSEKYECNDANVDRRNLHFTMQKYNWDTLQAVKEIAKQLHMSRTRIGFAGTKDKRALTTQRLSVWDKKIEDFDRVRIKDITLRDYSYGSGSVGMGDLYGNRFTVIIRNITEGEETVEGRINSIINELHGQAPSFFGTQRFGSIRPITHLVGREILRGDYKAAVMIYLAKDFPGEDKDARRARKNLAQTGDIRQALKEYPAHLSYESAILNCLVKEPEDFVRALRTMPKNLTQMFIHAYQGYVFNRALSYYLREKIPVEKLPLPGYQTELDEITAKILEEEKVKPEDFRIAQMKEISSKGNYRETYTPVEGLEILGAGADDLNPGKTRATIRFTLKKGNYATVLLRELMKN